MTSRDNELPGGEPRVFQSTWRSPLKGYENEPPLSNEKSEDGKSYVNQPREGLSDAYEKFVNPIDNGRRGGL
jgi:DOPA 4,5-dioxygenase